MSKSAQPVSIHVHVCSGPPTSMDTHILLLFIFPLICIHSVILGIFTAQSAQNVGPRAPMAAFTYIINNCMDFFSQVYLGEGKVSWALYTLISTADLHHFLLCHWVAVSVLHFIGNGHIWRLFIPTLLVSLYTILGALEPPLYLFSILCFTITVSSGVFIQVIAWTVSWMNSKVPGLPLRIPD
ncbi:hypothetical protein V8F20_011235 [Naviculisporaceae sp. PSN 640]